MNSKSQAPLLPNEVRILLFNPSLSGSSWSCFPMAVTAYHAHCTADVLKDEKIEADGVELEAELNATLLQLSRIISEK